MPDARNAPTYEPPFYLATGSWDYEGTVVLGLFSSREEFLKWYAPEFYKQNGWKGETPFRLGYHELDVCECWPDDGGKWKNEEILEFLTEEEKTALNLEIQIQIRKEKED